MVQWKNESSHPIEYGVDIATSPVNCSEKSNAYPWSSDLLECPDGL
jgi:hypothetical protein